MENNKKMIIIAVILLALLNGAVVFYKVFSSDNGSQMPDPFQQVVPQEQSQQPTTGQISYNGQMSVLPKTQPFVTAPQVYGSYENSPNSYNVTAQDYSSWSVDWERSRAN